MANEFRSDVYSREIDLSQVVRNVSNTYAIVVGQSEEGPVEPVFLSSFDDFVTRFGKPDLKYGTAGYSMMAFFERAGGAWFRRVVSPDSTYGGLLLTNSETNSVRNLALEGYTIQDPNLIDFDDIDSTEDEDDTMFYLHTLGSGEYSKNIQVEISSINAVQPTNTTITLTPLPLGRSSDLLNSTYEYQVSAFNVTGETLPSNTINIDPTNGNIVRLTWDEQKGVSGYRVYRSSASQSTFNLVARLAPGEFEWEDYGAPDISTDSPGAATTVDTPEFTVSVFDTRISKGIAQEVFLCSLQERTSASNQQTLIEDTINGNSKYITVQSNVANVSTTLPIVYSQDKTFMSTGAKGSAVTDGEMILALSIFSDREAYPASLFLDGGYTTVSFQKALHLLCTQRRWTIPLLSVPADKQEATESIDYRSLQLNINSSNGALFCNDCFVLDPFKNKEVAIPASADAGGLMAFTDRVANPAFSPAGFRRGILLNRIKARHRYSNAEKDRMAFAQVNYFESVRSFGILLKEAYTLQSDLSALSFIAVRRILNVSEESTDRALKIFLHEPNDEITEARIVAMLRDFYELMVDGRMIKRFEVYAETSDAEIGMGNRNIFTLIEPLIPIIRIRHTTVITKQGASFSEVIEQVA